MRKFSTDKPILCVGDLIADLHASFKQDSFFNSDVPIPAPQLTAGGTSSNTAADIVKLGGKSAVAAAVGADNIGRFLRDDIERVGVDTTYLISDPTRQTLVALFLKDANKDVVVWPKLGSANANYLVKDLPKDYTKFDIMQICGSSFFLSPTGETLVEFMERCKEEGISVVFDLNIRQLVRENKDRMLEFYRRGIEASDIILGSDKEISFITGTADANVGPKTLANKGKIVVCRNETDPVKIFVGKQVFEIPTYPVKNWVDVTGAGDNFNAGFLFGLSKGMSLTDAGKLGCACGAYCVTKSGARTCPDLKTAMAIINGNI